MMMIKIMIIMTKQIFVQRLAEPITIKRKIIINLISNGTKKLIPKNSKESQD